MSELWNSAPLADLASFRSGLWTGKKGPFTTARVIRNTNIRKHGQLSLDDIAEINVETRQLETRRLKFGDIVLERSGGGPKQAVGRTVCFELNEANFSFSNFTSFIRVQNPSQLSYRFLHLVLNWWYESGVTEKIQSNSTGIRNLDFNAYKALEEQQRIVAVLDEAFEGLARARTHAEANLQNARELFGQELAQIFSSEKQGWIKGTIEELCTIRSGTTVPKSQERPSGAVPYVKVADMNLIENTEGIRTSSRFLNKSNVSDRKIIPAGSTIFPKRGGAIMTNKKRKVLQDICADLNVMGVIPGASIDEDFLHFFFLSLDMREIGSGSAIPQINNYDINPLGFSYPPDLKAQAQVAETLQTLRDQSISLTKNYEIKIQDIGDLRQSLLQKAFAGELT